MNKMLNNFKKKLLSSGILQEDQLVGCSSKELVQLEEKYGKLPTSYKQVMKLLGKRPCPLISREFDFYIDDIKDINKEYQPILQEELEYKNIFKKIFIVAARYGDQHHFIWANGEDDSPVFRLTIEQELREVSPSIWTWMEYWIIDAKEQIKLREKYKQDLIKIRNQYKK